MNQEHKPLLLSFAMLCLSHATHKQRGYPLFLTADGDFSRHTTFSREGQFDQRGHLASSQRLTVEFERMRRLGDGHVGAIEWLQG